MSDIASYLSVVAGVGIICAIILIAILLASLLGDILSRRVPHPYHSTRIDNPEEDIISKNKQNNSSSSSSDDNDDVDPHKME